MIRAPFCDESYWDKWIIFANHAIQRMNEEISEPSGNPTYRPQYLFELTKNYWELMLYRYSRGDAVTQLAQYFPPNAGCVGTIGTFRFGCLYC
jgi:hypothetical protein